MNVFSSCVTNEPVLITGVYHSEDLSEYLQENHLLRRILHKIMQNEKINLRDEVQEDDIIWRILRFLYMTYFRHFKDLDLNDEEFIGDIATCCRNPIKRLLIKLAYSDLGTKSCEGIRKLLTQYTKQILQAFKEIYQPCDIGMEIDHVATAQVIKESQNTLPRYFQVTHAVQNNDLFLISSIHVDQGTQNSCPAKTIGLFAHFEDFSYSRQPQIVQIINHCKTFDQLMKEVKAGTLPPIQSCNQTENGLKPDLAKIVLFQTECQRLKPVKLLAWIQFPRVGFNNRSAFEIVLPRKVATKYVTASLINIENYMEEAGHSSMGCNVDMKSVSF